MLLNWISDLFWPLSCLGCRRAGVRLCRNCLDALPPAPPPEHIGDTPIVMAGTMKSPLLERAVWYLKYRNAQDLAEPLGDLMAAAVGRAGIHADVIVPIPLHPSRLRRRGYNQAALLAKRVALIAGLPHVDALVRVKKTASQVGTGSRRERMENMANAFEIARSGKVNGKRILLMDDVCTTGATLSAAADALRRAGASRVIGAVVTRG
ncbi:MAG TPA: ComF family protein [Candidatus Paceibacterota bacterium]|nr:ComF family protein [Candidatus Paceibacterota bacterium]